MNKKDAGGDLMDAYTDKPPPEVMSMIISLVDCRALHQRPAGAPVVFSRPKPE